MPRIRITTLTDKMKDEQVLSKLKGLGAKTKELKDKERAEESHDETKEKLTATGEKVIESAWRPPSSGGASRPRLLQLRNLSLRRK